MTTGGYKRKTVPVMERILRRCTVEYVPGVDAGLGPCWLSGLADDGRGYSAVGTSGTKVEKVHSVAYKLLVGPVPTGLELDHLCNVHRCFCPGHLQPVTHAENMRRADTFGRGGAAAARAKTHCPQGHPYDEANTYLANGRRTCRACRSAKAKEHSAAAGAEGRAAAALRMREHRASRSPELHANSLIVRRERYAAQRARLLQDKGGTDGNAST
jgi:hypothetical protein